MRSCRLWPGSTRSKRGSGDPPARTDVAGRRVVNETARTLGRRLFPSLAAERAIRFERGVRDRAGVPDLARKVSSRLGRTVLDGPFEGLLLPDNFEESMASPVLKLLGLYERQLRTPFMTALAAAPKLIANVGCADGYYAAGLALHARSASVAAFDISRSARHATEQLAALNGVADRVRVFGRCRGFQGEVDLVVCDIEGGEESLLVESIAELRNAMIIVETHDHASDRLTDRLAARFGGSHRVETLLDERPTTDLLEWLTEPERDLALNELRGASDQKWLVMAPLST